MRTLHDGGKYGINSGRGTETDGNHMALCSRPNQTFAGVQRSVMGRELRRNQ